MRSSNALPAGERKLPVQQLTILAICRLAEPLASTSLYPYLPEMIRSFEVPDEEVGKWAGICAAVFSIFQAIMGVPWGRASDRFGRKPAILLGLMVTLITTLIWGFSTSLPMAIAARAIAGAGNGNVGIIRTTVAEMVPYKELQPRAFTIMPLVWNIGSIFGPTFGGALANPLDVKPGERTADGTLLQHFPYLLPNLVSAAFFTISIITGFLFLRETLETKRNHRDIGLVLGGYISAGFGRVFGAGGRFLGRREDSDSPEREPLIKPVDQEHGVVTAKKSVAPPPWKEVLTPQTLLNLALYGGLAMHNTAFDQLVPVYMQGERPDPAAPRDNFLNFAGGFGLSHLTIGLLNGGYAVYGFVLQILLFPPVARRYGVLRCMKWCSAVYPIAYFLMPFTLLLPTQTTQVAACFALQLLKETCAMFAFPCQGILLTNSASSLRILGTVNGIATSVSAIGRAVGPALTGLLYSQGLKHRYLILSWWFLAAVAALSAVPVHFIIDGKGFGDAADGTHVNENESEPQQDEFLVAEGIEGQAESAGQPGPELLPTAK
ncbi:hypothetical protein AMS68_005036 [Peltaster fructicola]|uniref:Major facilitator superfamily (MFS) profile domain-containing protein n=1 Tax=Peltaster fructicola TaxID=286661 RepID=A0A6H0XY22_9PEZI|nr:hypothetical protein AMS68_005036 [Peltaster fructicola]